MNNDFENDSREWAIPDISGASENRAEDGAADRAYDRPDILELFDEPEDDADTSRTDEADETYETDETDPAEALLEEFPAGDPEKAPRANPLKRRKKDRDQKKPSRREKKLARKQEKKQAKLAAGQNGEAHAEESREEKKKKLRDHLFSTDRITEEQMIVHEESERDRRARRRHMRLIVMLCVAAVIFIGVLIVRYYQDHRRYSGYEISWEREISGGSFSGYQEYGTGVVKYTRDGALYISRTGEELWNQAYEMKSPTISTSGDYCVVYDQDSYNLFICSTQGCQGSVTTTLPITKACVSSTGVVAALLEDAQSSYLQYYDKMGNRLQIEAEMTLGGTGYPLDIDISPNGMYLMISYVYMEKGSLLNQVIVYNFDDEGQNVRDRIVGKFRDFGSSMVGRVQFLDDKHAVAFAQDQICLYSMENTVSPTLTKQILSEGEIQSILYSDSYVGAVIKPDEGGRKLVLYTNSGRKNFEIEITMDYDEVRLSGSRILFFDQDSCSIYNLNGNLKYEGALEGCIEELICLDDTTFLEISTQSMVQLKLK